jgi:Flp pilus assembly protein TadG
MSPFLIAVLGLAIDGSQMYAQWQMAQAAADAAAQAGALSIFNGTNATAAYPFGTGTAPTAYICTKSDGRTPCVYARDNGFGATAADTVTLSYPTTVSGVNLSSAAVPAITVTVQRTLQNSMIRIVGGGATSIVTAKATAALVGAVPPDCVYALDPSAPDAFQADNGATVVINGCGIAVDSSNASDAISITGGAHVSASAISVVGAVSINNGGVATPNPVALPAPVADPFISLPAPVPGPCGLPSNYSAGGVNYTLNPGTYCGGITVSNGDSAIFNPGIYIINGGGVSFGTGSITGSGVMFYLTGTNSTFGSVQINNGENVTLSAPTSGTYMGVLFFQDRLNNQNATFAGGATMQLTGSLYFPAAQLLLNNGTSSVGYLAIVAKQVSFAGGTSLQFDASGLKTGLLSRSVALVQ